MRRLVFLLPLLITGFLTTGCASVGVGETPWVLPGGRVRAGVQIAGGGADGVPAAIVDAGAGRVEIGLGRGVEAGVLIGADFEGFAGGGAVVKACVPARWPVAAFAGASSGKTSFGFYQGQKTVQATTAFGGISVGGRGLARPPGGYESLFPYATARLAWIDAREVDDDRGTERFRGLSPGVGVGVTMRETVGLSVEVGVQAWKTRAVPVVGVRLRL